MNISTTLMLILSNTECIFFAAASGIVNWLWCFESLIP